MEPTSPSIASDQENSNQQEARQVKGIDEIVKEDQVEGKIDLQIPNKPILETENTTVEEKNEDNLKVSKLFLFFIHFKTNIQGCKDN